MVQHKQAFTIIELLVVVLIIGILAAVALPQYQKSVDKSKYARMISTARSIENAQDAFYLANGRYANGFEELDVTLADDLPKREGELNRLFIGDAGFLTGELYTSAIYFTGEDRVASFTLYHKRGELRESGEIRCVTYVAQQERGKALCKSMGGELIDGPEQCSSGTRNTICQSYRLGYH
ncbi:MAG: type II secretion system protein [Elusimicrobiaceae bacterium]|nr:type II secretion system protein [Elusimicrobiaceae bacterium]